MLGQTALGRQAIGRLGQLGGGPVTLVIQDLEHAHSLDNVILTQVHVLVVQNMEHAQELGNVVLKIGRASCRERV